jgi:hypothetical protein
LERLRIPLVLTILLTFVVAVAGCGNSDPDPANLLDRALTPENLSGFGNGPAGPTGGVVSVQALGYQDRVLQEQRVGASRTVMSDIRQALGADSGLRGLVDDLRYDGTEEVAGVETDHISGSLDVAGLARALDKAGGGDLGQVAGVETGKDLKDSLSAADFDLYAGEDDGTIRKLDLVLAFDDPDNALPATRIRFSLTPDSSGATNT